MEGSDSEEEEPAKPELDADWAEETGSLISSIIWLGVYFFLNISVDCKRDNIDIS